MAQPDIHSRRVVEVELLQKKKWEIFGKMGIGIFLEFMWFFTLLVSAHSCQGHTEAGSGPLTLDTRVAATIFRAAAVGSDTRTGLQNFRGQRKTEPS